MAKYCKKPYKTPIANARAYLISKEYIDVYNNILNYNGLVNEGIPALQRRGLKGYGIKGKPVIIEDTGPKAGGKIYMNKNYFNQINKRQGNDDIEKGNNAPITNNISEEDIDMENSFNSPINSVNLTCK